MQRILIIDDEESIRTMMAMILQSSGYETLEAETGDRGLALAREQLPDLTVCDVNMPNMDGKSLLQAFRADPDLANRPVVIMTGDSSRTPLRTAMNLGADDYLAKPFTAVELLECVKTRLKRAEVNSRVEGKVIQDLRSSIHSALPHEFFTPLAGIIGISEILVDEAETISRDELRELAADIRRSGERLHRTLRNYLMIFEFDSGTGLFSSPGTGHVVSAEDTRIVLENQARAAANRHQREQDLQLELQPCSLSIEPVALAVLIEELVDNACSFSRKGTPVLVRFDSDGPEAVLRVTDRGRGMKPEQTDRIGAFVQFDRQRYEQQGLGLGLSLVRRLLQRSKGTFSLQSEPGKGTQAAVRLPAA